MGKSNLAPITPYYQTFHDIRREWEEKLGTVSDESGNISYDDAVRIKKEIKNKVEDKGYQFDSYLQANKEFDKIIEGKTPDEIEEALAPTQYGFGPTARVAGRVFESLGTFGQEAATFVWAGLDPTRTWEETSQQTEEFKAAIASKLPQNLRRDFNYAFDPYHGEGLSAMAETGVSTLIEYANVFKLAKGLGKQFLKKTSKEDSGKLSLIDKFAKSDSTAAKVGRAGLMGTAATTYMTLEETDEESTGQAVIDLVEALSGDDPELKKKLDEYKINPEDSKAQRFLDEYLVNLGIAPVFGALGAAFAGGLKRSVDLAKPYTGKAAEGIKRLDILPRGFQINFSSNRGVNNEMIDLMVRNGALDETVALRLKGRAADLKAIVQSNTSRGKQRQEVEDIISEVWEGNRKNVGKLPKEVLEKVDEMNKEFRDLEKMKGMTKGELNARISATGDTYVTRSYELFDFGSFQKGIKKNFQKFNDAYREAGNTLYRRGVASSDPDGVFTHVINSLVASGRTEKQAIDDLAKLVNRGDDADATNVIKAIITNNARKSDVLVGKKRKDLPQSIRDVLGEVRNPYRNYITTMSNLAKAQAEHDMLEEAVDIMARNGKLTMSASEAASLGYESVEEVGIDRLGRIFGRGTAARGDVSNPLQNVYADPAYKKILEQGMDVANPANGPILTAARVAGGGLQASKTVLSVPTWGVNVSGNALIMMANGFMPVGLAGGKQALKSGGVTMFGSHPAMKRFLKMSNTELADMQARYRELGLTGSDINTSILRRHLKTLQNNPQLVKEMASWDGVSKLPVDLAKFGFRKAADFYQFQDDMFKIMHFHKTMDDLAKTKKFKGAEKADLERAAAARTRDLMPNFIMLPNAVKQISNTPLIGAFPSFLAESVRITKNLIKYTASDLAEAVATRDKNLGVIGAKRLAGLTSVALIPGYLQNYSREIAGITKEQERAIENQISEFDRFTTRFYHPEGIKRIDYGLQGEREGYGLEYFNFGRIDPFNFMRRPIMALHSMIEDGEYSQDKMNALLLGEAESALSPFIGPSMLTDAIFKLEDLSADLEGETFEDGLAKVGAAALDLYRPTTWTYMNKRRDYERQKEREGFDMSRPITEYGTMYAEDEYDAGAFMGYKMNILDFTNTPKFSLGKAAKNYKGSGRDFYDALNQSETYAPEGSSKAGEIAKRSQNKARGFQQEVGAILEDYQTIFGPDLGFKVLELGISEGGLKEPDPTIMRLLEGAQQNRFVPLDLKIPSTVLQTRGEPSPTFANSLEALNKNLSEVQLFEEGE